MPRQTWLLFGPASNCQTRLKIRSQDFPSAGLELTHRRPRGKMVWYVVMSGAWARVSAGVILIALLKFPVLSAQLTLAWDQSPDPSVAGYKLYQGSQTMLYTNVLDVGNSTMGVISGLLQGATYFFAVTAYDSNKLESAFSGEVSYTVPISVILPQLGQVFVPSGLGGPAIISGSGNPGDIYEVQASQDLLSWQTVGSVTAGIDGTFQYSDLGAVTLPARFYRLKGL